MDISLPMRKVITMLKSSNAPISRANRPLPFPPKPLAIPNHANKQTRFSSPNAVPFPKTIPLVLSGTQFANSTELFGKRIAMGSSCFVAGISICCQARYSML